MTLLTSYVRVSKRLPCPICTATKWCLVDREDPANPATVVCPRVESNRRFGGAGWLHVLREGNRTRTRTRHLSIQAPRADLAAAVNEFRDLVDPDLLHGLAQGLGLPTEPLRRLGIGLVPGGRLSEVGVRWAEHAWTFPMKDAQGRVIGLRLRLPNGKKLCVRGSRLGLLLPSGLRKRPELLFVTEGETDTAALLGLGLDAIGRPGCTAIVRLVTRFVRAQGPVSVAVVADADEVGRRGAVDVADRLRLVCRSVRIVEPPSGFKDVREWVRAGATAEDVLELVAQQPMVALRTVTRGGRS